MSKREKNLVAIAVFMIVMVIAVGSTYAFWTTTQVQTDVNEIDTACLEVELLNKKSGDTNAEGTQGITLEKAYPISDKEGTELEGYTFTVKNNCDNDIYYDINLESLNVTGHIKKTGEEADSDDYYLNSEYIKAMLDPAENVGTYKKITDYTDAKKSFLDGTEFSSYEHKNLLNSHKLEAKGTDTHTLKMWIDSEAPDSQMSKHYQGKIVIYSWLGESNPYPVEKN